VPVFGPDGEVEAIAGTTRDVTERKEAEEGLRDANLRKDEFLAMLAHELRNPLAPISAAAEIPQMNALDERTRTSSMPSRRDLTSIW
jgi:signal transduction histidine kinase